MPSQIEAVHRRYGDRLAVVAINIRESRDTIRAWTQGKPLSFTILLDPSGAVTSAYEVTATPTVYLLARDGRLVGKAIGNKEWTSERGRALLDRLTRP